MEQLISEIEAFCDVHRISPSRFGEMALNDKPFVHQLKAGRDVKVSTLEKVRAFMAGYQPEAA